MVTVWMGKDEVISALYQIPLAGALQSDLEFRHQKPPLVWKKLVLHSYWF